MIDFQNGAFVKLKLTSNADFYNWIAPAFVPGEEIILTFRSIRDGLVFTNKRIMAINVQGITGKKRDFASLPYKNVQAFAVESAGTMDHDSELELWFSGIGRVKFEFIPNTNIAQICKLISDMVL